MSDQITSEWKTFADGYEAESIPLWKALALTRPEKLDEAIKKNSEFINGFRFRYDIIFELILGFAYIITIISLAVGLFSIFELSIYRTQFSFYLFFVLLISSFSLFCLIYFYQYGIKRHDHPLPIPHATDKYFEDILTYLQSEEGPQAYYLSWRKNKQVPLPRKLFSGKLRYMLFSKYHRDRSVVTCLFPNMFLAADVYLHREDVERMLDVIKPKPPEEPDIKPKRPGGPGRNFKYRYEDAIEAAINDSQLADLDLTDSDVAIEIITEWMAEWFEANAGTSGDVPRKASLKPFAAIIFIFLKKRAADRGS